MSKSIEQILIWVYQFGDLTTLINLTLKGTAILLFVLAFNRLIRRQSASFRYWIWLLGLASLMVIPLLGELMPHKELDVLSPAFDSRYFEMRQDILEGIDERPEEVLGFNESPPVLHLLERSYFQSLGTVYNHVTRVKEKLAGVRGVLRFWPVWIPVIWFAGFVFLSCRLVCRLLAIESIIRRARPVNDPDWKHLILRYVGRNKRLFTLHVRFSNQVHIPAVSGFLNPVLLLPEASRLWSYGEKKMVLLHEMAHIRRGDHWVNNAAQVVCAAWWPIPLVWTAAHRLRLEQEKACDDAVLRERTAGWKYASFLLDVASLLSGKKRVKQGAVGMASQRELRDRLNHILSGTARRRLLTRKWTMVTGCILSIVVISLAVMTLHVRKSVSLERNSPELSGWIRILEEGEPDERAKAAWALGDYEEPAAVPALIRALEDKDAGVRSMVAWALGEIKDRAAVEPLIRAVADPHTYTREMIVKSLGEIGDTNAMEALISASLDDTPAVRYAAVWALGEMHKKKAYEAVCTALSDHDNKVREMAIHVMEEVGTPDVVEILISMLKDSVPEIRERAAYALGRCGNRSAVESLIIVSEDTSAPVRIEAVRALGRIGDYKGLEAVMARLQDAEPEVRAIAVWAMDEIRMGS